MKEYRCQRMLSRLSRHNSAVRLMMAGGAAIMLTSSAFAQSAGPPSLTLQSTAPGNPSVGLQPPSLLVAPQVPGSVQANVPPPIPLPQPVDATINPNAPIERTELQGVPFPNMVPGTPRSTPLSNRSMGVDTNQTGKNMEQINTQTAQRLGEIKAGIGATSPSGGPVSQPNISGGGLQNPNLSGYASELQELAALQRSTRLLQARRQEAEAAMAVWGVLYDPRREDEAMRIEKDAKEAKEKEVKDKEAAERARPSTQLSSVGGIPNSLGVVSGPDAIEAAMKMDIPLPKIYLQFGSGKELRATLLVPYVGEVPASPGYPLPGGRVVVSVTKNGVIVRDPRMGLVTLGYGDSVPAQPPSQSQPQGQPNIPPLFNPQSSPAARR